MARRAGQVSASRGAGLAALLLAAGPAWAQAGAAAAEPPAAAASAPDDSTDRMLASTRSSVRLAAEGLARGVNSWFGDKPFEDGGRVTEGRLSVHLLSRQHESLNTAVRFHARWRLPNLTEKSFLYLGQGDRQEVTQDRPEALSRSQRLLAERPAERTFFAGLGVLLRDTFEFRLGFRGGLKPYAQASYLRPWQLSASDQLDLRETLFWTLDDHVGSTTAAAYTHAFSPTLTGRWLSAATITQRAPHLDWTSGLGAYQSFGSQRLLSLEALFSGVEGSGVGVSDYGLQTKWEQPIHRDWLLGELIVGHFWPKKDAASPRERAWALGLGLKLKF
jgi:hypothetical protein